MSIGPGRMFFVFILLLTMLAGISCGVDDDDDIDDDQYSDDDSGDDDAGDDAPDYSREPLAVLNCEESFADVGQSLLFTSEGTIDPTGGPLVYFYSFGDGATAQGETAMHAFAQAGAYRVVLTVTNDEGYADNASCIVSVGGFPDETGDLDEVAFSPNHYNPVIDERGMRPGHGGLVYGYFVSPTTATPDRIVINGDPELPDWQWCEVIGTELEEGQIGILRCHTYSRRFDAGSPIEIEVRAGETILWRKSAVLPAPTLTPSYITSSTDADKILVHVRNDSGVTATVTGLSINGADVSRYAVIDNPVLGPYEVGVIHVPRPDGVPLGRWTVFTVHGVLAKQPVSVSRPIRLFEPVFPVGDWNASGDDVFNNMENLEQYLDAGIDMFIYGPSPGQPPESVLQLAQDRDFFVFTHEGFPSETFIEFVTEWGDHPRILTNAVSGEGEFGGQPAEALEKLRIHRDLWGADKPMWIYNACSYDFPSWGSLADIGGMDHYCIWAPKCNDNWPPFSWDRFEFAGYYAHEIKIAAEPGPVWNWTQGLYDNIRCPTDLEARAQWYQVLGRGTKGMLWFRYTTSLAEACPQSLSDELLRDARELVPLKEVLLEGEVAMPGVVAWSDLEDLDIQTTVSPEGIAVILTNLDYDLGIFIGSQWREKTGVVVDVTPPEGFEPMEFTLLDRQDRVPLEWEKVEQGRWRFVLPYLLVAEAVLILPEP